MTPSPAVTADLAHDLRLAVARLSRRLRYERADHGLTMSQITVLATLERHGAMTAGALAAHERVRPPSMTRTVAALESSGMVTRTPDPTDGRQVLVAATPAAQRLLREDRRRREEWLAAQMLVLAPEERASLAAALPVLQRLGDS